jgi:predicted nucleic acid binding AN1-type Zn finger protein
MATCEICGTEISGGSVFTCTYCGGTFCPSHRLPFNHSCRNIEEWRRPKPAKGVRTPSFQVKKVQYDKKILIAVAVLILFFTVLGLEVSRIF